MHVFASVGRQYLPVADAKLSCCSARAPEMLLETRNCFRALLPVTRSVFIKYPYTDTLRNIVAIGLIDQMIEHHEAMVMLIRAGKIGSAFALSRSIFESTFRGVWFALCATDAQLEYFAQSDQLPLDASGNRMNMTSMATAIDAATGADPSDPADQFFKDLKDRGWKALCSYTHSRYAHVKRNMPSPRWRP
jgi:hypothetical protein